MKGSLSLVCQVLVLVLGLTEIQPFYIGAPVTRHPLVTCKSRRFRYLRSASSARCPRLTPERPTHLYSSFRDDVVEPESVVASKLDQILSHLTSAFPLFVLSAAVVALVRPCTLTWVNQGNIIPCLLASVMVGTGLALEPKDFREVGWSAVPLGVAAQFSIMPLAAYMVGRKLLLPIDPSLFLGMCLVGCSPGGTASNLVSLIGKADVALSVVLTACSTLLAVVATPLLVKLLVGSEIAVSGTALIDATARVILGPVLLGMLLNAKLPLLSRWSSRFTPFASVVLVSLICGGVVAQNASLLLTSAHARPILASVMLVHSLGFLVGYIAPKKLFGRSESASRTISIEVGMQNSALAVVLARSIGAPAVACVPGALSATAHSCLGSILAAFWRLKGNAPQVKEEEADSLSPGFEI